ncbi:glycoside hydrolase family 19 protein [Rhodococcus coprophilus]|uniref:Chitinase n=1 Tax=Rhodococcus coprophilus TaxID=38310 RepID=A0A2X4U130_9NOCA|nr:glycoside hydrolase family 19 protein [Rhodococcus coprophilus]MBM7460944.1 putative chitinase [Rhodococcus coprophilus]SQI28748.1 chitinase [Rhodococcus coprophilus]
MSVSSSRRLRAAIAAAAVITTAAGVGTATADASPAPSVSTRYEEPTGLLKSLDLEGLSTAGWATADATASVDSEEPEGSTEGSTEATEPAEAAPEVVEPAPAPAPPVVTPDELARIVPGIAPEKIAEVINPLNDAMIRHGIDTPVRQAAFIAQLAVESDSFRTFEEYASGRAYEGRADLGNVHPGDGERYKGRGAIQITGRHNYEKVSQHTGVDFVSNPEWLAAPENAFTTAAWYWTSRNLNDVAENAGIVRVSELVNGGHHALQRRIADFERGLNVLLQP